MSAPRRGRRWGALVATCALAACRTASAPAVPVAVGADGGVVVATPSAPVELARGTLDSGGRSRSYAYWAPNGDGPFPIVVALHGRFGDGEGEERLSRFSRVASRERFIVVFPDGLWRSWADMRGDSPASKAGVDDVAFLSALVADFVAKRHADPARVYFAGMSNGGFMTATVACALSERVAAIAMVAATMPANVDKKCAPARAVPAMLVLGDHDTLIPYAGGPVAGRNTPDERVLSGPDSARFWTAQNGCAEEARAMLPDADLVDGTRVRVARWSGCKDGADVALYTVLGGGHTWPGGEAYLADSIVGRTSRDFDASEAIWTFFSAHHR